MILHAITNVILVTNVILDGLGLGLGLGFLKRLSTAVLVFKQQYIPSIVTEYEINNNHYLKHLLLI